MKRHVIVVGCGAAGMAAAIAAASFGARVTVLEKNDRAGKKLYISGKGRCNVTNDCETADYFDHVVRGAKFLYSAVYGYDATRVRRFFTERGCPLKTERGGRVFPQSDRSSDVIRTLVKEMERLQIEVRYETPVKRLLTANDADGTNARPAANNAGEADAQPVKNASPVIAGVEFADGRRLKCDAVVVATGGLSYPATGSTGDGYQFAKDAGHSVSELFPSLAPFETKEAWHRELQGLSLKNVRLYTPDRAKPKFDEQGEMLFTHFGVSGPLVLSASAVYPHGKNWSLAIDLKPALTLETLEARLARDFEARGRKQFKNSLDALFPTKLIPVMTRLSGVEPEKQARDVTKAERAAFAALIKRLPVTVADTRGFREAIITRGGVALKEINPSTMASKKTCGLYFAGEILDCDALTGGYNLQIAWSTGRLAGKSAAAGDL